MPISYNVWWFATHYYFLMLFAPIINAGLQSISRRKFKCILCLTALSLVSGCAYFSSMWNQTILFLFLYILGRYIRVYNFKIKLNPFLCYSLSVIGILFYIAFIYFTSYRYTKPVMSPFGYGNPLCITMAVSLFFMFKKLRIPNLKIINKIATGCFAVYLMTDGVFRPIFNDTIIGIIGNNIPMLILTAIITTIILCGIDNIRQRITKPAEKLILSKLDLYIVKTTIKHT